MGQALLSTSYSLASPSYCESARNACKIRKNSCETKVLPDTLGEISTPRRHHDTSRSVMDSCDAKTPEQEIAIARMAFANGDLQHAMHHLAGALAADPLREDWLELLDEVLDAGNLSTDLAPIDGDHPPYFGTVSVHAYLLARQGRIADAVDLLLQIVLAYPFIPYLEWALRWLDRPEAAGALRMERIIYSITMLWQQFPALKGQTDGGRATLDRMPEFIRKVRATQPPNADFLAMSVSLLRRLNLVDEALQYAKDAYEIEPGYRTAVAVAVAQESKRAPDLALAAYRDALRFEPNDIAARLSIGDLLWHHDRTEEAEKAYTEALAIDPNEGWALPSQLYLRWCHTGDEPIRFKLLALADIYPDNERAQQLAIDATPYHGYLPEPSDATTNMFKKMLEEKGSEYFSQEQLLSMSLTCLEAPSNFLALPGMLSLDVTVVTMQSPDPRLPRKPVEHVLWKYEGTKPIIAVPPPDPAIADAVAQLAKQSYHRTAWWRQAGRIAAEFGPGHIPDLLATMVHPPQLDAMKRPWGWVYRVQVAAALILAQVESDWIASARRQALFSLLWGPMDWTVDAAIIALAALASEEEQTADEILDWFREARATLPTGGASCYLRPLLWSMLGLPNLDSEERTELRRVLREWHQADEDPSETHFKFAQIHEKANELDKALAELDKALAIRPDFAEALELRGAIHLDRDEFPSAIDAFTLAIEANPDSAYAFLQRGEAHRRNGEYAVAILDFDEAARLRPKAGLTYLWRGLAHQNQRDYERALADFEHALSLGTDQQAALHYRGRCLRQMGSYDDAIRDLTAALELDPALAGAFNDRAWTWRKRGDFAKAIADFTSSLALTPSAFIHNERAACHYFLKQYAEAVADHAAALGLEPTDAFACNGLAWILATCPVDAIRDGPRAVELASKACEWSEWGDAGFLDTLACAYAESGDFAAAVRWTEKVLEICTPKEQDEYRQRLAQFREAIPFRAG
jgi:tetratricopeptide (TPR) repeat protein